MEVKFGVGETSVETTVVVTPTLVEGVSVDSINTVAGGAVATVPEAQVPSRFILGDKLPSLGEIFLPRLNLTQNIGLLKDLFDPGTIVLNQQTALFIPGEIDPRTNTISREPTAPTTMTFLGFRPTRFCEKVGGGVRGAIVDTEEEVIKNGGTLDYGEWQLKKASGMKYFEYLADVLVAVEQPEIAKNAEADFSYTIEEKHYALAFWALRGVLYTELAKRVLFTHRRVGCLREKGYSSWSYSLSSREKSYPTGNKAWIPIAVPKARSSEAFVQFVEEFLTGK